MVPWKLAWQAARNAAAKARRLREREAGVADDLPACEAKTESAPAADEPLPASRMERARLLLDEMHDAQMRARVRERDMQIPLALPEGDAAALLEKQIASSAALIGYLSNYVARTDTDPSVCMSFMDRMTSMLGASANVGKVVGRLRGQVSRSEQNINVNHLEGERGRG